MPTAPAGAGWQILAPAKLNLTLHVVGRRPDGYHRLDSFVAFADLGDTVTARPAEELSLALDGPFAGNLSADPDNLVWQAAAALAGAAGIRPRAALTLTKRLPVQSGIGGGSTDAAAALKILCRLWRLDPSPDELAALALRLGADVPVCLRAAPTRMRGIGEVLEAAPAPPPAGLVLVNPGFGVPTPEIFKAFREAGTPFSPEDAPLPAARDAAELAARLATRGNDLTAAASARVPAIAEALAALGGLPGCLLARMSGSGATSFGLFELGAETQAARRLAAARPEWWVRPARLLGTPPEPTPLAD